MTNTFQNSSLEKRLEQKINRLKMQKSRLQKTQKNKENNHRKARTRTLIQAGGLLQKSGLLETFNITPGDDLQGSQDGLDKAAQLLGFLLNAQNKINVKRAKEFESLGKAFLK